LRESRTYFHPDYPYIGCNPDREVVEEGGLVLAELKTASVYAQGWGQPWTDEVPKTYLIQAMDQMAVTGAVRVDIAVLIGGNSAFQIHPIPRDEALCHHLIETGAKWWQTYMLNDCPPPLTDSPVDERFIMDEYPADNGETIAATPELEQLVLRARRARIRTKKREDVQRRYEILLREYMGEAAIMTCGEHGQVTYKSGKKNRTLRY
jgi:predicted phage-related endonuclease